MSMEKQEQGGGRPRKMTIVGVKWRREGATNYGATAVVALHGLEACRAEQKRGERQGLVQIQEPYGLYGASIS